MTMRARIERLEEALAVQAGANRVTSDVLIYDRENPPDFDEVERRLGLLHVVWLPHNSRCDLDPKDVLCGEKPQTSGR